MKQTPESLDFVIAFLADAMDIRERERGFYALPADEQTSEAEEALKTDLRARVVALSEQYGVRLQGTVEVRYLSELVMAYKDHDEDHEMTMEMFIDRHSLSVRAINILSNLAWYGAQKANIPKTENPRDLLQYDASRLLRITGFGTKSLLELDRAFVEEGWHIQGIEKYRETRR